MDLAFVVLRFESRDWLASKSEELKKAVAVSEEKIQQRSRRPRPIFQQPFSLPESAQTLAGIAFCAAGKSGNHFQQRRNLPENLSSREFLRKIRAPIKIKSALPPPPPNPKYPPPLKRGILWTQVFLQKERIFSRCP